MVDTLGWLMLPLLTFALAAWALVQAWRDCLRLLPARPHLRPIVRRLYGLSPLLLLVMAFAVALWAKVELSAASAPPPATTAPPQRESLHVTPVTLVLIASLSLVGILSGTIRILSNELLARLGGERPAT